MDVTRTCNTCGKEFTFTRRRGRAPTRCPECQILTRSTPAARVARPAKAENQAARKIQLAHNAQRMREWRRGLQRERGIAISKTVSVERAWMNLMADVMFNVRLVLNFYEISKLPPPSSITKLRASMATLDKYSMRE